VGVPEGGGHNVIGHAGAERGIADQHGDRGGVPGEVQRRLAGRVTGLDDDVLPADRPRLRSAGAIERPGADERLEPRHPEAVPGHSGRDDHGPSGVGAVGGAHHPGVAGGAESGRGLGEDELRAEQPRLLDRPPGQLFPADPMLEAEIVADQ